MDTKQATSDYRPSQLTTRIHECSSKDCLTIKSWCAKKRIKRKCLFPLIPVRPCGSMRNIDPPKITCTDYPPGVLFRQYPNILRISCLEIRQYNKSVCRPKAKYNLVFVFSIHQPTYLPLTKKHIGLFSMLKNRNYRSKHKNGSKYNNGAGFKESPSNY